jgi:hypothetical protein
MHTRVAAEVDALDRDSRQRERRALDRVRCAEVGEDRPVMVDVRVDVA